MSCHQSILVPRSPYLTALLAGQRCGAGVSSVSINLQGVKPDTVQRLVDYLYTGTCSVRKIKHVMEMIEVKKMLQLDINIEKRIYKKGSLDKQIKKEDPVEAPAIVDSYSLSTPAVADTETVQHSAETVSEYIEHDDNVFESEPQQQSETKYVPPLKLYVKPEPKPSSSDEKQSKVPYENKLRLKVENNSSGFGATIFERVVQSITADSEEEDGDENEGEIHNVDDEQQQTSSIDYESIRQEMYKDVVAETVPAPAEDAGNVEETVSVSPVTEAVVDADSDREDNDDDDSSSSSDSSDSSSDDESSDSEDENEKDNEKTAPEVKSVPAAKVAEDTVDVDDDDDGVPVLPGVGEGEDGVPTIPASMLIEELERDERRINQIISAFVTRPDKEAVAGDCAECGHSLSGDNFVLHYGIHVEDLKAAKKKLEDGLAVEEATRMELEMEKDHDIDMETAATPDTSTASYEEPTPPPTPPDQKPVKTSPSPPPPQQQQQQQQPQVSSSEETIETKINKLQENQKRLSRDIVEFMSRFQRGAKTLECSECGESVTMATIVGHFKAHINGLSRKIEVLMMAKRDNKRKHERGRDESQKKKMREASSRPRTPIKSALPASIGGPSGGGDGKPRIGTEEERKKMYKRIYGRKKYQYRIRNCAEDVKVSEEEIDAEIAKENAKYSGHPSSGMLSPGGSDHGTSVSPQELLRNFVQFGSKEYKHEFKKARDRLYKRKLRVLRTQGIMDNSAALDIPRADIEVEMLSRYTANKTVQAEMEKRDADTGETADPAPAPGSEGGGGVMHEVRVKTETSVLEEDLELSLDNVDMGELFAEAQSMLGDTTMSEIVSAVKAEQPAALPTSFMDTIIKTTLEEGVGVAGSSMLCSEQ